ncbi:MAG TPA: hypothetical protein VN980_19315 [Alphaproteobacteria bacterium]|nr:hypothetical protein [Alphaproteobacteria bacterium]
MGRIFAVRALRESELPQAFPLVHALIPRLRLEAWLRYAQTLGELDGARAGVMSAFDEQGYICGLFCYRMETGLEHGPKLLIEHACALDIVDRQGAIDALLGAIDDLARALFCAQIDVHLDQAQVVLSAPHGPFIAALRARGAIINGIRLSKPVENPIPEP